MGIVIRRARVDEQDAVARVLLAAFAEQRPRPERLTPEHREVVDLYFRDIADVASRFEVSEQLVALDGDRVIGAATLYAPEHPPTYPAEPAPKPWPRGWATSRLLAVDPSERCRGVGRALSEARIRRAREMGAVAIALHTTRASAVARDMVRRTGYRRVAEHDFSPAPGVVAEAYVLDLV